MRVSKCLAYMCAPFAFFSLPLGLGNSLAQPFSLLLVAPAMRYFAKGCLLALPLLVLVTVNSLYSLASNSEGASIYQFARSWIPFVLFCVVVAGTKGAQVTINNKLDRWPNALRSIDLVIYGYAIGQVLQVILFEQGIGLANAASSSEEGNRVLLYPTTATLIFLFYSVCSRKYHLLAALGIVVLATGSKTMIAAATLIGALALVYIRAPMRAVLVGTVVISVAVGLVAINPTAINRAAEFISGDRGEDVTRAYEISHARQTYLSSTKNVLIGNGLSAPLTPGVPTSDDRWFENSKFDIENAYWAILSKLGILGSLLLLGILLRLPFDYPTTCVYLVLLIFGFKTSYQYFATFDGTILILSSVLVRYALRARREQVAQ